MLIGCLALAAFPPFSGSFLKDEIIARGMEQSRVLRWCCFHCFF